MAALDFPASPSLNQQYVVGTDVWVWNGTAWEYRSLHLPVWWGPGAVQFNVLAGNSSWVLDILGNSSREVTLSMSPNAGGNTKATFSLRVKGTNDFTLIGDELAGQTGLTWGGNTVWTAGNDGAGSGLDADLLDGQSGAFYQSASNLNAGTIPDARFSTRQTTTPTVTAASGTFTTVSCEVNYQRRGDIVHFDATITITTNGTAAGSITVPMPFTAVKECVAAGRQAAAGGAMCQGVIAASSSNMTVVKYDNTYPGATGERITLSGHMQV